MRHAGSLPQLTSPTSTSMLMKRTSSGGGKDHGLVSFMIFYIIGICLLTLF